MVLLKIQYEYFNSRPRKEVDTLLILLRLESFTISTHDLARRSTPESFLEYGRMEYFNSRPRKEVDTILLLTHYDTFVFQLTTSQGGRLSFVYELAHNHEYFNSRPRKEVDTHTAVYQFPYHISTHDLARRSTSIMSSVCC